MSANTGAKVIPINQQADDSLRDRGLCCEAYEEALAQEPKDIQIAVAILAEPNGCRRIVMSEVECGDGLGIASVREFVKHCKAAGVVKGESVLFTELFTTSLVGLERSSTLINVFDG